MQVQLTIADRTERLHVDVDLVCRWIEGSVEKIELGVLDEGASYGNLFSVTGILTATTIPFILALEALFVLTARIS